MTAVVDVRLTKLTFSIIFLDEIDLLKGMQISALEFKKCVNFITVFERSCGVKQQPSPETSECVIFAVSHKNKPNLHRILLDSPTGHDESIPLL